MGRQVEIGVMLPQSRKLVGPPEAGRDKNTFSYGNFRGSLALLTPGFGTSSRIVREEVSVVLNHSICGNLLRQP